MPDTVTGCIYEIVCRETAKRYIGSSTNVRRRWSRHKRHLRRGDHDCRHLQAAWHKYGEAAFDFAVVTDAIPIDELLAAEALAILNGGDIFNTVSAIRTAASAIRFTADAETRAKLSAIHRGVPKSMEHRAKIAAAHLGVPVPLLRGRQRTDAHRAALSEALKGKPKTAEAIAAYLASRFKNNPPNWLAGATPDEIAAAQNLRGEARRKILSRCARRHSKGQVARVKRWREFATPEELSAFPMVTREDQKRIRDRASQRRRRSLACAVADA